MAGIGADQRAYMMKTLRNAIALYYGDKVPTVDQFKKIKRKTFIEKLEERLGVTQWRERLSRYKEVVSHKQGALTTIQNNYSLKTQTLGVEQNKEMEELKAKHNLQRATLELEYRPKIEEAKQAVQAANNEYIAVARESYFTGLGIQDDGTDSVYNTYRSIPTIDDAVLKTVDGYMETNLKEDQDGELVFTRQSQENLISDLVQIADDMKDLRKKVLAFISSGKLPPITFEAWFIENGKDIQ